MNGMSRVVGLVSTVVLGACIEPVTPSECAVDAECGGGLVCSAMQQCARVADLHEVEVEWRIDGEVPSAERPGRCPTVSVIRFTAGAGHRVVGETTECTLGRALLTNIPRELLAIDVTVVGAGNAILDQTILALDYEAYSPIVVVDLAVP